MSSEFVVPAEKVHGGAEELLIRIQRAYALSYAFSAAAIGLSSEEK